MPPSVSLEEGDRYVNRMRQIIKSYPEVERTSPNMADRTTALTQPDFSTQNSLSRSRIRQLAVGVDKARLTDQMKAATGGRISRCRLQLFPVHRRQCRRDRVRGKGRELGQIVRQRSRSARKNCYRNQEHYVGCARHYRSGDFQRSRPTHHRNRYRSSTRGQVRLGAGDINSTVQAAIGAKPPGIFTRRAAIATFHQNSLAPHIVRASMR